MTRFYKLISFVVKFVL